MRRSPRVTGLDSLVDLVLLKFPKTTHTVGGYAVVVNPLVNDVIIDPEIFANLG